MSWNEFWSTCLIILHVVSGHMAILAGLFILFTKKGNKLHLIVGKIYGWTMLVAVISAMILAFKSSNIFLFTLGIFVIYQLLAGWNSAAKKIKAINWIQIILLGLFLLNGLFMIYTLNLVLIVFGGLSVVLAINDIRYYRAIHINKIKGNRWLARHIGLMMGSLIGGITAFLVVNVQTFQPAWVIWFLPTVILVPLIAVWTRQYVK